MRYKSFYIFSCLFFIYLFANGQTKLPYPIIFIHGLNSSAITWNPFTDYLDNTFGTIYGGHMNFCLNADADATIAYYNGDYKDFNNNLIKGDYYYVNFAVGTSGYFDTTSSIRSNQQAIFKQGRAIRDAIKHVLDVSGSDKVILFGHSMGGLAAREYVSNPIIWQSDGKHHVAKIFTNSTPHGGSNSSLGIFSGILVNNLDDKSEAVRDLRTYYNYLSFKRGNGAFLFGGVESDYNILYSFINNYKNVDVNCNNITDENITGLNYKTTPDDILYSCAYGISACLANGTDDVFGNTDNDGDGVVGRKRADMNNYLYLRIPLLFNADTFIVDRPPTFNPFCTYQFHTKMTSLIEPNMRGLDEPNTLNLAYNIDTNKTYLGWVTESSNKKGQYEYDFDCFKINIPPGNKLRVTVTNTGGNMTLGLVNSSTNNFETSLFSTRTKYDSTFILNGYGPYYFYTGIIPIFNNYSKYNFKLTFEPFISIIHQPISQTICGGNFATFSVAVAGVGPFSYRWNNGSTNSNLTTSIVGSYFVTVTGLNGTIVSTPASLQNLNCFTVSAPVIVKQPISQTVCGGIFATFTVSVSGQGSMSYKWNDGSTNSSLVTSTPGVYFVTVTGINGRVVSSIATLTNKNCTVTQINSIDQPQPEISVFPNPTTDELTISISNLGVDNTIELINELGLSVLSIKSTESSQKLDLTNLSKGFYILSIQIDQHFRKIKILKE